MDQPVKPLERIQQNLLARSERRLINAICPRLPAWVKPDHLTALGLFGALLIGAGYWASKVDHRWLWLSIGAYFIHWFGDSLDGSLARFRKIERPRFGYFIDHSTDALGTLMIVGGLGLSPYIKLDVALVALAGYYLLSIHAFLAARVVGEMKLSYVAAGPTELRSRDHPDHPVRRPDGDHRPPHPARGRRRGFLEGLAALDEGALLGS